MKRTVILRCSIPLVVCASVIAACGSEPQPDERLGTASASDTKVCTSGTLLQGVDTSSGNGTVDWVAAKAATPISVDWAIMKATQAADYKDPGFPENWAPAKAAGVVRGAYHFFDPTVDGATQAAFFLAQMGPLDAEDLSPTLDVECPTGPTDNCLGYAGGTGVTPAANFRANMLAWLNAVEAATGRKPIIYTYLDFFSETGAAGTGTNVDTTGFDDYPLWIADPPTGSCFTTPSPWTQAAAWQYEGDTAFETFTSVDVDRMIGPIDELLGWPGPKRASRVDIDGDGKADICGRDPTGVVCSISSGTGFGAPFSGPAWSDGDDDAGTGGGWRPAAYASTVQFADVNGDGKADVCGRASSGILCAPSTGSGFGAPFAGPVWSDTENDAGIGGDWNRPEYYATIQFPDVNGDGKADACARAALGITCALSTGTGFGAPFAGPSWSDAAGWNTPSRYRTIRFPDLDGDGKADVCGRASDGIHCALSTGTGFGPDIVGPAWSDASGWNLAAYASTIQFPDVNGDGKADICGRGAAGLTCALSTPNGFAGLFPGPAWSDAADEAGDAGDAGNPGDAGVDDWSIPAHYATIVFLDINGDGADDVCGRSSAGMQCAFSTGTSFGPLFDGPVWSDAQGWSQPHYYGTIGAGDVNGDGKDDLCARGAAGVTCAPSTGTGFGAEITGPAWSDAVWGVAPYWETTSVVGLAYRSKGDGGPGGTTDGGNGANDGGLSLGNATPEATAPSTSHGCSCDVARDREGSTSVGAACVGAACVGLALGRRRKRRAGDARD